MPQMSNVEPRRTWGKIKYQSYWTDVGADEEGCLSCGRSTTNQPVNRLFCGECLEWSSQSNLDEHWDDLGGPG